MSATYPAARMTIRDEASRAIAAMLRLETSVTTPPSLRNLIAIRASQINGCAFCLDMHWKDARAAGESEERLYMLEAWRESPLYDDRERAALELCEAMTLITDGHVPDAVWEDARSEFDDGELANLVFAIAVINTWNRLNITIRLEPGHYQPAQATAA